MKKRTIRLLATMLLVISSICCITLPSFATNETDSARSSFVYPTPAELALCTTRDEQRALCQIPESILENMSSEELVDAILNYPYLMDINAYNDYQIGYQSVRQEFNGLQEFEAREDATKVLINKYTCNRRGNAKHNY